MSFNFNDTIGVSQSGVNSILEGNNIYTVKFDGCEARDIQGVQDASKIYKVLDIKFSCPAGKFVDTIWEPKDVDAVDRESAYGPTPSNVKAMMLKFKHLIDAVNPTLAKQIDSKEKNLNAPNWDSLRKLMVQSTEPGVGTETKIKLIKNKKGEAIFPYFAAYSKEGRLYMKTNFIGSNILWTAKELQQIEKANNATPTKVANTDDFDKKAEDLSFDLDI